LWLKPDFSSTLKRANLEPESHSEPALKALA
jgi:hypothetical protein